MMIKRLLDIGSSLFLLILLAPLMLVIALLIRVYMGSPIFFSQQRPGLNGKPFCLYKFRTMNKPAVNDTQLQKDKDRLTSLGRVLRRTSLDELPQLINVLKGDLSLVGPRPLLMQYLDRYTPEQGRRHEIKPGITGWAQVNGRNAISWEDKFLLDVWYVDHYSIWLDLKILGLTFLKVLRAEGISGKGTETMSEFMGSNEKTDGNPHQEGSPESILGDGQG